MLNIRDRVVSVGVFGCLGLDLEVWWAAGLVDRLLFIFTQHLQNNWFYGGEAGKGGELEFDI